MARKAILKDLEGLLPPEKIAELRRVLNPNAIASVDDLTDAYNNARLTLSKSSLTLAAHMLYDRLTPEERAQYLYLFSRKAKTDKDDE